MKTPIELLVAVAGIGGQLSIVGDKLRMVLPADCQPALKDGIRRNKSALVKLMRLNFVVVRSRVLSTIVFFTSDEATKESLVAVGADPRGIYTRAELRVLVHRKITPQELRLVHAAKQWFNGEVRN